MLIETRNYKMEDVKQSIVKVGKEIDQLLEKLDKCQSESDKAGKRIFKVK